MPANQYGDSSQAPTTQVDRVLRQRELRLGRDRDSPASDYDYDYDSDEEPAAPPIHQRLLVVADRLPVSAVRSGKNSWLLEINEGGFMSALVGVNAFEARWIGWPGVNVPDEDGQRALTEALSVKKCIPVFLTEEMVHQYYNGYCSNILWPLFHYLGLPREDCFATTRNSKSQLEAYKETNQMFADVVNKCHEEGDAVWCHDYHLMFLPKNLKDYNSKMKVGWFLHTPFPSSEIHRTLPSSAELLQAILAADLVGFHTYDYARHFVSACTRILGLEGTPEGVEDQGILTRVAAFPIGIDSERFIRALEVPQVQDHIKELKERFSGRKVMLGVDDLDMIKGIPQKLLAFEKFLEENPDWRDKVVLLQIAVPTRSDIPEYQKLTSKVHEIVGRINGRFGSFTAVPVHHLDRSVDFLDLCALYSIADVALVTSLRDGMNLVSYEFVACQDSKKGVLILSEFAGAAQSLGAGAILINPWNITEVAEAIGQALNMPAEEREERHWHNFEHVTRHTSQRWAESFVSGLNDSVIKAQQRIREVPPQLVVTDAVRKYLQSNNRLLILGFYATLTEVVESLGRRRGDQIKELEPKLHPDLKEPLKLLCRDPNTTILVLSGSDKIVLDDNFGEYDMWLAAENGMLLRSTKAKGEWIRTMPEFLHTDWFDSIRHIFEYFTERTPRSQFVQRETSLLWNYKYADVEFGRLQARDMLQHLYEGPMSNSSADVFQGSRTVEVRAVGVTKGAGIDCILGKIVQGKRIHMPIDYVLCVGHFLPKDEDVYTFFEPELSPKPRSGSRTKAKDAAVKYAGGRSSTKCPGSSKWASRVKTSWSVLDLKKENYFSCAVGRTRTSARYLLNSSDDVAALLMRMAAAAASASSSL